MALAAPRGFSFATMAIATAAMASASGLARPPRLLAAPSGWVFPLRVHAVAPDLNRGAAPWLDAQVASANRYFAAFDVQFVVHERVPLEASHAVIETTRELASLDPLVDRAQIDVFVVASLVVDRPDGGIIGICPGRAGHGGRFVAVAVEEDPSVLAHELGHYFGLDHSTTRGNLMFAYVTSPPYVLDATQGTVITQLATQFERDQRPAPMAPP
jgi:hypothetical protein